MKRTLVGLALALGLALPLALGAAEPARKEVAKMRLEATLVAVQDGTVLVAVPLDDATAAKMARRPGAKSIQRAEQADDGALLGKTLYVRYGLSPDAGLPASWAPLVGTVIRFELRRPAQGRIEVVRRIR